MQTTPAWDELTRRQVSTGKILEDSEIPVWVITFSTQEMLVFRNAATREVVVGAENRVEQCTYAAVITRVESELGNEITGGWKVVEVSSLYASFRRLLTDDRQMARRSSRAYL